MGLTTIISSVLHPFLSHYQDQPQEIYVRFVRVLKGVAAISVLASMVLFVFSDEVIWLMLGDQWGDSAPLLRLLSLSVMSQMCISLTGAIFQSLGRTDWMFVTAVINTAITVAAIAVGCWAHDLELLALLVCLAYVVNPVATFGILIAKGFKMSLRDFLREMAPNLIMAAVMAGASIALVHMGVSSVLVRALACAVVYGGLLLATGEWRSLKALVK